MLKPARMRKARVIVLRAALEGMIRSLHQEGFMEMRRLELPGLEAGRPLEFYNDVSEELVKLRGIAAVLEKCLPKAPEAPHGFMDGSEAVQQSRSMDVGARLKALGDESVRLEGEAGALREQVREVAKLVPFRDVDFSRLETRTLSYCAGEMPSVKADGLRRKLGSLPGHFDLLCAGTKDRCVALLMFQKTDITLDNLLSEYEFQKLQLPAELTMPAQTLEALRSDLRMKEARQAQIGKEMKDIAAQYYPKVALLLRSLKVEADRAEIASRFGFSKSACVLEGWVKEKDYSRLEKVVASFGEQALLSDMPIGHGEMPPTVLENPGVAGPFEFLTRSYSLPNYNEIDPSMLYMLFVPLLLGMIVGDAIYGVVTIFLALFLMKKFEKSYVMSNVSQIWLFTGFTSILFGLVFDEWAGFHHKQVLELLADGWGLPVPKVALYEGLSRLHQLPLLIGITVLVGLVHLGIGFMLGAINEWGHNKKHALAKIAWIGVEIGGTVAVASAILNVLPADYAFPAEILLGISVLIIAVTEGIVGILEVPGLMGNALSYARIAAIGVVGVVLAEIINEFFAPRASMGLFLIVAVPLFFVFHFANLFIAIFEALIQGGRLNLIEFRSKFLKGGGSEFAPFSMEGQK